MRVFALRKKGTKLYMTEPTGRRGRGSSHSEFAECALPRLFRTERSAKCALTQWLRGKHEADMEWDSGDDNFGRPYQYQVGTVVTPVPTRVLNDYEIVEFSLVEMVDHASS